MTNTPSNFLWYIRKRVISTALNSLRSIKNSNSKPMPSTKPSVSSSRKPSSYRERKKMRTTLKIVLISVGVRCGARTHDTQNHNLVLYQLN